MLLVRSLNKHKMGKILPWKTLGFPIIHPCTQFEKYSASWALGCYEGRRAGCAASLGDEAGKASGIKRAEGDYCQTKVSFKPCLYGLLFDLVLFPLIIWRQVFLSVLWCPLWLANTYKGEVGHLGNLILVKNPRYLKGVCKKNFRIRLCQETASCLAVGC